jgi:hypothetical protein
MLRIRRKILIAALALAGVFACNTPSVPIPPPVLGDLSFQMQPTAGQVVLVGAKGAVQGGARMSAINRMTGDGVITTAAADGSFTTTPFAANVGDTLQLYYDTVDGQHSEEECTLVQFSTLGSVPCQ